MSCEVSRDAAGRWRTGARWRLLAGAPARACVVPSRPITCFLPVWRRRLVDQYMRALSVAAAPHLGQSVIIENKPGAGGTLSAAMVARAHPDGYTLAMTELHLPRPGWNPRCFRPDRFLP